MIHYVDANGVHHPISDYTDYHILHKYDGKDTLEFCLDTSHEQYPLLHEECKLIAGDNEWLIKKIDDDRIEAAIDFDFLKSGIHIHYESASRNLREVLEDHLPSGWIIEGANMSTITRTITFDYCTDYDVIMQCMDTYSVCFMWKTREHKLIVVAPNDIGASNEYVTSELNLRAVSYRGSTEDFATRLYAYGADGLTLEEAVVTGHRYGLTYVEDKTYSSKTVCAYWSDERYTDPDNLYAAAVKKIAEISRPVRSYECDVVDLAKIDARYSFLYFSMHKKIALLDPERKISVEHQIVQYDEYPDEPAQNVITLSCVPGTIQSSTQVKLEVLFDEDQRTRTSMAQRIAMATAMITGAFGGYTYQVGADFFLMDDPNPAAAQTVWRFNINGFGKSSTGIDGPYTTAITVDDAFITSLIEAMTIRANLVQTGVLKSTNENIVFDLDNGTFEIAGEDIETILTAMSGAIELRLTSAEAQTLFATELGKITFEVSGSGGTTTFTLKQNGVAIDSETVDLHVKSVNVDGTITADAINLNTAQITGQLTAANIDASNLNVAAANITGTLVASQIDATNLHVSAANIDGTITANALVANASIASPTITGGTINIGSGNFSVSNNGTVTLAGVASFNPSTTSWYGSEFSGKGVLMDYLEIGHINDNNNTPRSNNWCIKTDGTAYFTKLEGMAGSWSIAADGTTTGLKVEAVFGA